MDYRELGRTGWRVSTISFGAWAIGGTWGDVRDEDSIAALHRALDRGVNFFDTADVYGDGRSERLLARLKRERREQFYVVTKAGRRLEPHVVDGYNRKNLSAFLERSLRNLETDTIDLLQLLNHIRSLLLKEKCSIRFELGILFVSETRCRFLARNGHDLVTRFLHGVECDTVL